MRMTTVIETLRSWLWVKKLLNFCKEIVRSPDRNHGHDDGDSEEQHDGRRIGDENGNKGSSDTSPELSSDSPSGGKGSPGSNSDSVDELSSTSTEVHSLADDDQESRPPENGEHSEFDGNESDNKPSKIEHEPREIGGRRGRKPPNQSSEQRSQPPPSRPELVCRKSSDSWKWGVVLCADEECQVEKVQYKNESLKIEAGECHLQRFDGLLTIAFENRSKDDVKIPLFDGKQPLIFKLRKNWDGEGRRIQRVTNGYFIVIAPNTWQRTGHARFEAEGCADPEFRAHYFYRDATSGDDGFLGKWVAYPAAGVELKGMNVFDDSDDGMLFVGKPPDLKQSPDIERARVGEEAKNGWGQVFQPDKQLLAQVLDGREGWFFLRVYDSERSMRDSVAFRYVRDLTRIEVDGVEYTQDTVLVPESTGSGYRPMQVRFVGTKDSTLKLIKVPPHPDADRISCTLGSDAGGVDIVLDLPRIWWRLEDGCPDPGEWRDTPFVMTREEFRKRAYAGETVSLLSKRYSQVRAGFDKELGQQYTRKLADDLIAIPLDHFVDYTQIDRRLNDDAHFNVEWAGETVTLIEISADPKPEIVSFTAEPSTIVEGEEVILKWITRNADDTGAAIAPDVGAVESCGTRTVRPTETSRYTLNLAGCGTDDIGRTVEVTVHSSAPPGGQLAARVYGRGGRWRNGKGFSYGELNAAGLTVEEAAGNRSIRIDRRRRTSHRTNIEAIRSSTDA